MKTKYTLTLFLIIFISVYSYGQKTTEEKARKKFNQYAYVDAIETYKRLALKGYKSVDMFQKLGDSYYFNGDLNSAVKWYDELFAMKPDIQTEYLYRYSQSLKSVGDYD